MSKVPYPIIEATAPIIIGAVAGIVSYMYKIIKGEQFRWLFLFINIIVSCFICYIVGGLLPSGFTLRDPIIGMAGLSAYRILELIEIIMPKILPLLLPEPFKSLIINNGNNINK